MLYDDMYVVLAITPEDVKDFFQNFEDEDALIPTDSECAAIAEGAAEKLRNWIWYHKGVDNDYDDAIVEAKNDYYEMEKPNERDS